MRIVKLHHPKGSPIWNRDEFKVEFPDGSFFNPKDFMYYSGRPDYVVKVKSDGIYFHECTCGQGFGKSELPQFEDRLIIKSTDFDKIEYVGEPLVMNQSLEEDYRMMTGL